MVLRANIKKSNILMPIQRSLVPTGLFVEIPVGYEARIRPRSGQYIKKGITVLNLNGTNITDYRGEVCIIMINLSGENIVIKDGGRIGQMVFAKHEKEDWEEVNELKETI